MAETETMKCLVCGKDAKLMKFRKVFICECGIKHKIDGVSWEYNKYNKLSKKKEFKEDCER